MTATAIMLGLVLSIYLIPTFIAYGRKVTNRGVIVTFNVLVGWTGLGWVAALIWAITDHRRQPPTIQYVVARPPPPPRPGS